MVRKNIANNYIYNLLYQILTILTPLITTPLLSRVLGADGAGTVSFMESVVSYFVLLASMGTAIFGQREISYVQDDKGKRTIIFWEVVVFQIITTFIASIAYILFSFYQFDTNLYMVLIFNIFAVSADVSWFFQGIEEFGKVVLRNVLLKCINIVFIYLFVRTKDDLIWYMLGHSFCNFLCNLSLWFYLPKYVGKPIWREITPTRNIKSIISLFIPTVAVQVYTVLDKTMIGVITQNSYENGYYEEAIKLTKLVMTIVTALCTVMVPRIGYEYEKGNQEEIQRLMYTCYRTVWMLGVPLCIGLTMVASNFVPWFFGDGFDKVIHLLGILSPIIIAIGISSTTGTQYLIPTKREKTVTATVIAGAVINFLLNIFLIREYGSEGAAVASVITETVVSVVQLFLVRKELNLMSIIKEGTTYFAAGGIMGLGLYLTVGRLSPSFFHTFILVGIGALIYFVFLLVIKDELFMSLLLQVYGAFNKVAKKSKQETVRDGK